MQKPRFRTADKSAWVFIHTKLHPHREPTMNRRTALRCGYLASAARVTGRAEKDLPLPFLHEPMSKYLARIKTRAVTAG